MKVKFFVAFLVILLPLTLASETQHRFKVYVSVSGDDRQAVNTVESHLKRELRLLGDVDIVGESDNWAYIIEMFVLTLTSKDGRKTGNFAIATRRADRLIEALYDFPTAYKTIQATCFGSLGAAYYSSESLPEFCVIFVNDFDKYKLEPIRALKK